MLACGERVGHVVGSDGSAKEEEEGRCAGCEEGERPERERSTAARGVDERRKLGVRST